MFVSKRTYNHVVVLGYSIARHLEDQWRHVCVNDAQLAIKSNAPMQDIISALREVALTNSFLVSKKKFDDLGTFVKHCITLMQKLSSLNGAYACARDPENGEMMVQ